MRPLTRSSGTIFYSLYYFNSRRGCCRLTDVYPVISVNIDWLPANSKIWKSTSSWTARLRFFASWAGWESNIYSEVADSVHARTWSNKKTADMDCLHSPDDPYNRLGPVYTCLYVRVTWDWWLGPLPDQPKLLFQKPDRAGVLYWRGVPGLASLIKVPPGYPPSGFNKISSLKDVACDRALMFGKVDWPEECVKCVPVRSRGTHSAHALPSLLSKGAWLFVYSGKNGEMIYFSWRSRAYLFRRAKTHKKYVTQRLSVVHQLSLTFSRSLFCFLWVAANTQLTTTASDLSHTHLPHTHTSKPVYIPPFFALLPPPPHPPDPPSTRLQHEG